MPFSINSNSPGVPAGDKETINLAVEELEAIRLKDLEGLDQESCAVRMKISRPTFHRVLSSARLKVAKALVESVLLIEGDYKIHKENSTVPVRDIILRCPLEPARGNRYGLSPV